MRVNSRKKMTIKFPFSKAFLASASFLGCAAITAVVAAHQATADTGGSPVQAQPTSTQQVARDDGRVQVPADRPVTRSRGT
jgi:hypothetical protein